jgi:hypothetical protein
MKLFIDTYIRYIYNSITSLCAALKNYTVVSRDTLAETPSHQLGDL